MTLLLCVILTDLSELKQDGKPSKPDSPQSSQAALVSPMTTPRKSQPSPSHTLPATPTVGKKICIRNKAAYVVYEGVVPGIYEKW